MSNEVTIVGAISSNFTYDHSIYGEKYYRVTVTVTRDSGTDDIIPVMVSERLINITEYGIGTNVIIKGQYRSYNSHEELKTRLLLFVFAQSVEILSYRDNYNEIFLEGYVSKPPVFRQTPLGREICDVMLGVPRAYNKSDYIPCVMWGKTAKYVSNLEIGDYIRVAGRVQSREYVKNGETRVAYDVSINLVEVLDDGNNVA